MRRRDFIALAGATGAAMASPRLAFAQQSQKAPRIAYVGLQTSVVIDAAFRQGLADHSYVIGRSVFLDYYTAQTFADLPALAAMAVASHPDLIVTVAGPSTLAAKQATTTIPIVFISVGDPVAFGFVDSLARPGGNVTGNTNAFPDLASKQVQLIREIVPDLRRLAIIYAVDDPYEAPPVAQAHLAAAVLHIEPFDVKLVSTSDLSAQYSQVDQANAQAAFLVPGSWLQNATNRPILYDLLLQSRLPAVSGQITIGLDPATIGVVGYGPNTPDLFRSAADFVDAIFKGAKPADLPVQQATTFDLVVNLKAAKTLGLTISSDILAQATQVVE